MSTVKSTNSPNDYFKLDPLHDRKVAYLSRLSKVGSQLKHLYELYNVRPERDLQAEGIKTVDMKKLLGTLHLVSNSTGDFPKWRHAVLEHINLLHDARRALHCLGEPWRAATARVVKMIEVGPHPDYSLATLYEARYILSAKNWLLFEYHLLVIQAIDSAELVEHLGFKLNAFQQVHSMHSDYVRKAKKEFAWACKSYTAMVGELVLAPAP